MSDDRPSDASGAPSAPSGSDPRRSPLHAVHEAAGASFTDFGGWLMPLRYTSELAEHRAVREAAGLFDISHMAEFLVTGQGAAAFLDRALAGDVSALRVGRARYSLVLAEDGGVVDDVIVYRVADDRVLVVANAGNREAVGEALAARERSYAFRRTPETDDGAFGFLVGHTGVLIEDVTDSFALIAVQGPAAQAVLEATEGIDEPDVPWDEQRYYAFAHARFAGEPLLVARTGYTGEDGFELLVRARDAAELWRALTRAGEPLGIRPCGLAARDTLRLEAGMPLYGHELGRDVRPDQAGLGRVVALAKKGDFVGRSALERPLPDDARVLVGLVSDGRRAGRAGYAVLADDREVGTVTSGALSPTLGHPIAMALVDQDVADGRTGLAIDVRGTRVDARITPLPFYTRKK